MSSEAGSAGAPTAKNPYAALDLERAEGITTRPKELPQGARHGGGGKFVLNDLGRSAEDIFAKFDVGDHRNIPDASAYQHARAAWYHHEDDLVTNPEDGRKYAVLTRSYQHPADDEDDEYAVTLRSSPWKAGMGEGDDYSPFYSYDVTVKPLDEDGTIAWDRTPPRSLSLSLEPQYADLVYPDGNELRIPHGEGTLVRVSTTWVEQSEEFLERAAHLLGSVFNYGLSYVDVADGSGAFSKAEAHHRVVEESEGDLVHTIRQSAELLARHDADVTTAGVHEDSKWLQCKIRTSEWEQLGFANLDAPILLKLYYPDDPDAVEYPMDQPKLEVALDGKETVIDEKTGERKDKMIPWDRWDEVMTVLDEILLSHLEWADVSAADLVADDYSDGANNPRMRWRHPEGRRYWLRKHYESLVPAIYREATRTRTDLVLDILDVVRRRGGATYQDLVDETGAAERTVREHVRRLEQEVGGDDRPGILTRIRDAVTTVAFSSRFLEELGDDAIDTILGNREEMTEDRSDRADDRVLDHLQSLGLSAADAETLVEAVREDQVYGRDDLRDAEHAEDLEPIVEDLDLDIVLDVDASESVQEDSTEDLDDRPAPFVPVTEVNFTLKQLANYADEGHVDEADVGVRADNYSWIHGPPG